MLRFCFKVEVFFLHVYGHSEQSEKKNFMKAQFCAHCPLVVNKITTVHISQNMTNKLKSLNPEVVKPAPRKTMHWKLKTRVRGECLNIIAGIASLTTLSNY